MDVREKLEVIAHLGDHITYKDDIGICYDSALAKVIEDAYMELKNGVTVQEWISVNDRLPTAEDALPDGSVYAYTKLRNVLVLHYKYVCRRSDYILCWMPMAMPKPPKGE